MFHARKPWLCALAVALIASAGCGSKLQPAGGKVLVDGVPVTEGTIMFYPVNKGRPATARIMQDGTFTLSYENPGDGLPPGEYKVVIVADVFKEGKKTKAQEADEANMKRQGVTDTSTLTGGTLIHIVPPEYNDISTTPLKQTVTSSGDPQDFVFDIPVKTKK
jgi:hypothetical protein